MRAAATAVLILLFVQGCVFPVVYCTRSEAPEVTQEQSTRDDVVAVLGEPYATTEVKGRSIDVYDYDGFCALVEPVFFSRFLTGEISLRC